MHVMKEVGKALQSTSSLNLLAESKNRGFTLLINDGNAFCKCGFVSHNYNEICSHIHCHEENVITDIGLSFLFSALNDIKNSQDLSIKEQSGDPKPLLSEALINVGLAKQLECCECHAVCEDFNKLISHFIEKHGMIWKKYGVNIITDKRLLLNYPKTKLNTFFCPIPGCKHFVTDTKRCFVDLKGLRQHYKKVHVFKGFGCDLCHKRFVSGNELENHQCEIAVRFECNECDRTYKSYEALQTHARRTGHSIPKKKREGTTKSNSPNEDNNENKSNVISSKLPKSLKNENEKSRSTPHMVDVSVQTERKTKGTRSTCTMTPRRRSRPTKRSSAVTDTRYDEDNKRCRLLDIDIYSQMQWTANATQTSPRPSNSNYKRDVLLGSDSLMLTSIETQTDMMWSSTSSNLTTTNNHHDASATTIDFSEAETQFDLEDILRSSCTQTSHLESIDEQFDAFVPMMSTETQTINYDHLNGNSSNASVHIETQT